MKKHTRQQVVIVGAGGHGREIFALLMAVNIAATSTYNVVGFVDDGKPDLERLERLGISLIGDVDSVGSLDAVYVIGVGKPEVRRTIDSRLLALGAVTADHIEHPASWIGPDVELGSGSIVCAGVSVTTNVRVGRHVHLNRNVTVGHDSILGDFVTVAPMSAISGNVTLDQGVELGTGVTVLPGIRIGKGTLVGADGTVTRNLPAGVTAVGSPAKPRAS